MYKASLVKRTMTYKLCIVTVLSPVAVGCGSTSLTTQQVESLKE
jgi:hypothetical protein